MSDITKYDIRSLYQLMVKLNREFLRADPTGIRAGDAYVYVPTEDGKIAGALKPLAGYGSMAGRRWNETMASPIGEVWGNIDLLRDLPSVLGLGCYLVRDDRTRRKLDPSDHYRFIDGTTAALDGSMGQYMWCWNAHYYSCWTEGDYFYEAVSLYPPRQDSYFIPAGGTSALGAGIVDRTNLTLCSVINNDPRYRGGNNNADWDGTHRSLLGMPATILMMSVFSTYARRRGEGWEANWFVSRMVQEYLFRIIMGTRNSQADYIPDKDSNGLFQGGLGPGLTDITTAAWTAYNNLYPLVPTNAGVELGDGLGVARHDILNEDGSVFATANIPVFLGLKNLWGHIWSGVRGVIVDAGAEVSTVYIAPSLYNNYSNTSTDGMIAAGNMERAQGYIKQISMNKLAGYPTEVGGSAVTYYADNNYSNHDSFQGLRGQLGGGGANAGTAAGAFVRNANNLVTHSGANVSVPLCYFEEDPIID